MGDARLDYEEIVYGFFDKFLKGEKETRARQAAQGHLLHDGPQQVADLGAPGRPRARAPVTFYLSSGGRANTLYGDGALALASPRTRTGPTPSATTRRTPCSPAAATSAAPATRSRRAPSTSAGWRRAPTCSSTPRSPSRRARSSAARSCPRSTCRRTRGTPTSRSRCSTSTPDGTACNLDESIQRMRYRDGYDKPLAWMEKGKVYKVTLQPLNTSNYLQGRAIGCASRSRAATSRASTGT